MESNVTRDDVGKTVVTEGGQDVGTVTDVEGGMLYVDFTHGETVATGETDSAHEETIPTDEVAAITDDEIVLREGV
ncbi:PRC-barrel domain-containing protein [Halomarina pelagica]|uniref:PRC-barrel domain-containing protein n=1 Tax=Halomarina pelagica TaxID=2961599 RepID=UPI0020C56CC0|nr:PRC-barrel domain-containing protein [Halomarina sp. BND7]